jgi:DNA-binding CsgD family transcriptional regulator
MKKANNHLLKSVWEKFPEIFAPANIELTPVDILHLISEIFVVGDYYYYLIDFQNYTLHNQSPSLCAIHGLESTPTQLQQILDLIHPDDIKFILRAEENCYAKVVEIGAQHTKSLKSSYCFRMRVADGSYHLFHHQAIVLDVDSQHQILRSLNIHTDIQHLTTANNYIATLMGINGRTDFHQIDLSSAIIKHTKKTALTRRELEILPLIAKGLSSRSIARQLAISVQTVQVHRKNLLKKMQTSNSSALVKKCIEEGLL